MFKKEKIIGALLFIIVLGGYFYTITPTLPFWDCGEFIACAFTMGVPHPPGTPLMVIIGSVFTKIFFFISEVAVRVNLMSAISSALSALFLYLIMMNIFSKLKQKPGIKTQWINIISSFSAGLAASFFYSVWLSSVEAEVYTPSMFITLLLVWITLKGWDRLNEANDDRFIFLIIYLAVLSVGISMLPLLALPGCFLFFIIVGWNKHYDLSVSIISFSVFFAFLFMGMTKESIGIVIAGGIFAVLAIVITDYLSKNKKVNYKNVFKYLVVYLVLIFIAITPYLLLIYRARHNPYINIAAPVSFSELWDVFNRKQYGPMVFLPRNTDTGIGTFPAIMQQFGMFLKYYSWQFGEYFRPIQVIGGGFIRFLSSFLMAVITATGLFGMYAHFRRDKKTFILLMITFLLLSVGLVLYLNLKYSPSDLIASHQPREVRERDYFYLPAYFFFMLFGAFGIREIMLSLFKSGKEQVEKVKGFLFSPIETTVIVVILLIAIMPFVMNFKSDANRRGNWIADEYAKNMLITPEPNSIVFTNGDNDTYPLWFEQTVREFRVFNAGTDGVLVVNLSLLNVNWYIKQMKSFGVPISMTDSEIDNLLPVRLPNGDVLMTRDIVIRDILYTNTTGKKAPKKVLYSTNREFTENIMMDYQSDSINVYFSVTVSENARAVYKNNCVLEGLAFRVVSNIEALQYPALIDIEKTNRMINEEYKYEYILNDKLITDDNVDRIKTNYASGFLQLGIYYANIDSLDLALEYFKKGRVFYIYDQMSVTMNMVQILRKQKRFEEALREIEYAMENESDAERIASLTTLQAEIFIGMGDYNNAMSIFKDISEKFPEEPAGYIGILRIYKAMNDSLNYSSMMNKLVNQPQRLGNAIGFLFMQHLEKDILIELLDNWLRVRPNDTQAVDIRNKVSNWK